MEHSMVLLSLFFLFLLTLYIEEEQSKGKLFTSWQPGSRKKDEDWA